MAEGEGLVMPYRGINPQRIALQTQTIFASVGQTVTWRAYVSASAGVPAAGIGSQPAYAQRTITALFAEVTQPDAQANVGMLTMGQFLVVTREQLGKQDELLWRGTAYRVESDPTPYRIDGFWQTLVKRGK
jgi:hypothetical protein